MNPQDKLVYFGDAVKAVEGKPNTVGGYLVRFSTDTDPDLTNEFFTKETEFGPNTTPPTLFHHGLDSHFKSSIIGQGEWSVDDVGVWYETQLSESDAYWPAVQKLLDEGKLYWSSGAVTYERQQVGKATWLKTWIIGEASLTPTPAEPRNGAIPLKSIFPTDELPEQTASTVGDGSVATTGTISFDTSNTKVTIEPDVNTKGEPTRQNKMDNTEPTVDVAAIAAEAAGAAVKAYQEAEVVRKAAETLEAEEATKATALAAQKEQYSQAAAVVADASHWKYDNYAVEDLSFATEFLNMTDTGRRGGSEGASDSIIKALALRMDSAQENEAVNSYARNAYKAWSGKNGIKANEVMQSTLASYGDEWVGVAYSSNLWNEVRSATAVVSRIPSFEFPAGAESFVLPIESTDPVWYIVAQASAHTNPGGQVTKTVTSSRVGTGKVTATLAKLGARVFYTGELSEDAVLPVAGEIQRKIATSGAEYLESAVIDGDKATGGTTNINDIAGTPAATDWFLGYDGFRLNALVTNTANSRDAGVLTASDFLETAKLLGTAGQYAEPGKMSFIVDANTYWKALELPEVKTRDVFSGPTIENGRLTGIWGYDVTQSFHMHKAQTDRKANSAGKVDVDTSGNNATGSLLAIRWDQWQFGFRRRMTLEVDRIAAADTTEIVAMMRTSLINRNTDASAISYNITL